MQIWRYLRPLALRWLNSIKLSGCLTKDHFSDRNTFLPILAWQVYLLSHLLGFGFFKKVVFCFMKISLAFIKGIVYFCTRDGFFRILKTTSSQLLCAQLHEQNGQISGVIKCMLNSRLIWVISNTLSEKSIKKEDKGRAWP